MEYLSSPTFQDQSVRLPVLLYHDQRDYVLIMTDLGGLPTLKERLKAGVSIDVVLTIGTALGRFLANVHNVTSIAEDIKVRFASKKTAKDLCGMLYFGGLLVAAEKLGYKEDFLREAARTGQLEIHESSDVLTLGDF